MSRRNKVLEAVVLASLMAIPGMAGAEAWYAVGPVSVDGGEASKTVVVSNPTAPYQVGKAGSAVEVGDFGLKDRTDRYSALAVLSPSEVVFTGRTISTKALEAEGGAKIVVGDADTESVTIAGDENTTGLGSLRFDGEAGGTSITVTAKNIDVSTAGSGDGVSAIWGQNGTQSETAPEGAASVTLKGDTIHTSLLARRLWLIPTARSISTGIPRLMRGIMLSMPAGIPPSTSIRTGPIPQW